MGDALGEWRSLAIGKSRGGQCQCPRGGQVSKQCQSYCLKKRSGKDDSGVLPKTNRLIGNAIESPVDPKVHPILQDQIFVAMFAFILLLHFFCQKRNNFIQITLIYASKNDDYVVLRE